MLSMIAFARQRCKGAGSSARLFDFGFVFGAGPIGRTACLRAAGDPEIGLLQDEPRRLNGGAYPRGHSNGHGQVLSDSPGVLASRGYPTPGGVAPASDRRTPPLPAGGPSTRCRSRRAHSSTRRGGHSRAAARSRPVPGTRTSSTSDCGSSRASGDECQPDPASLESKAEQGSGTRRDDVAGLLVGR